MIAASLIRAVAGKLILTLWPAKAAGLGFRVQGLGLRRGQRKGYFSWTLVSKSNNEHRVIESIAAVS